MSSRVRECLAKLRLDGCESHSGTDPPSGAATSLPKPFLGALRMMMMMTMMDGKVAKLSPQLTPPQGGGPCERADTKAEPSWGGPTSNTASTVPAVSMSSQILDMCCRQ
mmetsp:Transcript_8300/g.18484  ORF Transcript_8300/g.18484 Transcript_8300/m.18484 type:complete len:109 (+) Transcript_8300:57-383(+)